MDVSVGNRLKTLRKQRGLSQEEVADFLHLSQSAYARIEKGESNSWASYINNICDLYEIAPEDLLKQENIRIETIKGTNGAIFNSGTINNLSDKLIEQYNLRLQEKDLYINKLEQIIDNLVKKS